MGQQVRKIRKIPVPVTPEAFGAREAPPEVVYEIRYSQETGEPYVEIANKWDVKERWYIIRDGEGGWLRDKEGRVQVAKGLDQSQWVWVNEPKKKA
jgi:hypothetical protein